LLCLGGEREEKGRCRWWGWQVRPAWQWEGEEERKLGCGLYLGHDVMQVLGRRRWREEEGGRLGFSWAMMWFEVFKRKKNLCFH
jgi:hypothetical protein